MKVENIDIKDVKENVDEVLEEEVATDNHVEDEIINQENPQILTKQNQGKGSLFKLSIILSCVFQRIIYKCKLYSYLAFKKKLYVPL